MIPQTDSWKNRIVEYGIVDPAKLIEHSQNWRAHPDNQHKALKSMIDKVGIVDAVIVQRGTNLIVDGHLRVAMAVKDGVEAIPVQYVDLDDDEVAYVLATFDPVGSLAETDLYHLTTLVSELDLQDDALNDMLNNLINDGDEEERDYEPVYEPETVRSRFTASDIDYASDQIDRRINQEPNQIRVLCPKCHKNFYIK